MKNRKFTPIFSIILIVVCFLGLLFGGSKISIVDAVKGLFNIGDSSYIIIMRNIRLPRVLSGILAGVGLSISGVLIQSVTNNNLASPNIIGVNSGAGCAVILTLFLIPSVFYILPIVAFFGALLTTLTIVLLSQKTSKTHLILSGVAVTTVLNAVISFVSLLNSDILTTYNYFSIGGLASVNLEELIVPGVLIILSLILSIILAHPLQILSLGDNAASSLGVKVKFLRIISLVIASLSAAAVVSFAGLLGFVGLVVPNITRKIIGHNVKINIIISSLLGSIIVVLADLLGRTVLAPTEIPVGILMALIGGPFLLYLLIRGKNYA